MTWQAEELGLKPIVLDDAAYRLMFNAHERNRLRALVIMAERIANRIGERRKLGEPTSSEERQHASIRWALKRIGALDEAKSEPAAEVQP